VPGRRQRGGTQRRARELTATPAEPGWLYTSEGQVRAYWRFALFVFLSVGTVLFAAMGASSVQQLGAAFGLRIIVHPLVLPAGMLAAHALMLRWFHRGDWSAVGLDRAAAHPRAWRFAALLAPLAIAVPVALLLVAGWLDVARTPDGSSLAVALRLVAFLVPAALGEELVARGYVFALLREVWGWRWAIAVTSVGFGALHLANPGAHPQAILTVVLAGMFLGFVLVHTASLYAAWAAHAAWNLALSAVLHADVSGVTFGGTPDYKVVDSGPDWITGGPWGPEGGIAAAAGLLVATWLLARRRPKRTTETERLNG
jgi:membrane protease YdiL (CAAX protease family)